mgnify:CR=1 FL=1
MDEVFENISNPIKVNDNLIPLANFSVEHYLIVQNQQIKFYFCGRFGNYPNSLFWDFGDGSLPDSAKKVAHTFQDIGEFEVKLTMFDSKGNKRVVTETSSVTKEQLEPRISLTTTPAFEWKDNPYKPREKLKYIAGTAPLKVVLDAVTSILSNGKITLTPTNKPIIPITNPFLIRLFGIFILSPSKYIFKSVTEYISVL